MPASSRRVGRAMESLVPTRGEREGATFNQKLPAASLPVSAPYGLASAPSDTKEGPAPQEVAVLHGGRMESTPGGRLAVGQETSCWLREYRHRSFIVPTAGKRLETGESGLDANNPETNLPPFNPLLVRSLAPAHLSLRLAEPPISLSLFLYEL